MNVKSLMDKEKITGDQLAQLMRPSFPSCSKTSISLGNRPDASGVRFTARFRRETEEHFGIVRRPHTLGKPRQITLRVTDAQYDFLRAYMDLESIPTINEAVGRIIELRRVSREM